MATQSVRLKRAVQETSDAPGSRSPLLLAAPLVALAAGLSAQWLDFRALRVPLLLIVGFGVLAMASVLVRNRRGWPRIAVATLVGIGTWAAAETSYAIVHVALGEHFHASRFGSQPLQAVGLIVAHGVFLGAPTGLVAGLMLQLDGLRRTRT
jgi:hypothetical protein